MSQVYEYNAVNKRPCPLDCLVIKTNYFDYVKNTGVEAFSIGLVFKLKPVVLVLSI